MGVELRPTRFGHIVILVENGQKALGQAIKLIKPVRQVAGQLFLVFLQVKIIAVVRGIGTVCQDKICGRNGVKIVSDLLQRLDHTGVGNHHDHIGIIQQGFLAPSSEAGC